MDPGRRDLQHRLGKSDGAENGKRVGKVSGL